MKDDDILKEYSACTLCAHACRVNRTAGQLGVCASGAELKIARAALHFWEEPIISSVRGSGTVFFTGCSIGCVFCQNREISRGGVGCEVSIDRLSDIMLELQAQGANNVNFVTPTHYAPSIIAATRRARERGFALPIVYNTGSYDSARTVKMLKGTVDIFLADYKYHFDATAAELSLARDYPSVARAAIDEMVLQRGAPVVEDGIMKSGVIVRILLLPSHLAEAKLSVKYLYDRYGDEVYISLMSQYTPMPDVPKSISRRVTHEEYEELVDYARRKGVKLAFIQDRGSADADFIPPFDMTGV